MSFDKKTSLGFIDVASGKTSIMICSFANPDKPVLLGKGEVETKGFVGGRVVNFSEFSNCVNKALEIAELQAGGNISNIVLSLSDFKYRSSYVSSKEIEFPFEETITKKYIEQCAYRIDFQNKIDRDKEAIIHIVPVRYVVDGNKVVLNPEGIFAKKIRADYHIVTVDGQMLSDFEAVLKSLNLTVVKVSTNSYASSQAVLVDDDKNIGSLVIDIGKSSMSVAAFVKGSFFFNCSFLLGGDTITNWLSRKLNVRFDEAERLKIKYGVRPPVALDFSQYINAFVIGENGENEAQEILKSTYLLCANEVARQIVQLVYKKLSGNVLPYINRIILTGGGSKLTGLKEIFEDVFDCSVRVGRPVHIDVLGDGFDDVEYSTLVGLYLSYKNQHIVNDVVEKKENDNLWRKFKSIWDEYFG